MMIGTPLVRRISRHTSKPCMPGRRRSSRTTLTSWRRNSVDRPVTGRGLGDGQALVLQQHPQHECGRRRRPRRSARGRVRCSNRNRTLLMIRPTVPSSACPVVSRELNYPAQLPITERRAEIVAALRDHRVVVVAGETGSGKSTQLPKLCLEAGRGIERADRAHPAAAAGGAHHRRTGGRGAGRRARRLGRVRRALHRPRRRRTRDQGDDRRDPAGRDPARPDAAALRHDHRRRGPRAQPEHRLPARLPAPPARAARRPAPRDHLGDDRHRALRRPLRRRAGDRGQRADVPGGDALPPVRPGQRDDADDDRDQLAAIADAVEELRGVGPGDVLVFLSGEREIHDAADHLRRLDLPGTEVLPLYARLSAAEQHRIFQPHRGRRIVLSTNVAETSLTVPGVRLRRRRRHGAHLPLQHPAQGPAPADRAGLAGVGEPARRALRTRRTRARASACTARTTSPHDPSSPSRRSCAPTSPRSSCR